MKAVSAALVLALGLGCTVREMAAGAVADALTSGGSVFARDGDPELIREAVPFGLKTYESLLEELPDHPGLLLACASGFTQYAYAFVMDDADRIDVKDLARARQLRDRARGLLIRGRDYAMRGLELSMPGVTAALPRLKGAALAEATVEDVPFLYWAGAAWAAALTADKDDLQLVAELPLAGELFQRALELDETWSEGALHEIMISYEGGRSEAMGGSAVRARLHYKKAMELSKGLRASVHLALAEGVLVREQKLGEFKALLAAAEAVDPDAVPSQRLMNVLARRRAAWLRTKIGDLFLDAENGGGN
jgi:hypothetical protein